MPGVYGYIVQPGERLQVCDMRIALSYKDNFVHDPMFTNGIVEAGRVHVGNIGPRTSPLSDRGVSVWVEGECYNESEVDSMLSSRCESVDALILGAYLENKLDMVLKRMDGYFCCAIYDARANKVLLVTDRYGMRPLYCYSKSGRFAWASEVKALLALDFVDKTIDPTSANCFMELGYLLGEHTWFQHVRMIGPARVVEFSIDSREEAQRYYWSWSEIEQNDVSFDQAVDGVGDLLMAAVRRRFDPCESIGISLSGGLDSRAILALVTAMYPEYEGYAFTFGRAGCDDVEIAKRVVSKTNWRHDIFEFSGHNWLNPRFERVWQTDGMLSVLHMHGSDFLPEISQKISINLNGYAGDVVAGGGFLTRTNMDRRIDVNLARQFYGSQVGLAQIDDDFYDIEHVEPHLHMNRVRRFTNVGSISKLPMIDQRKPFFDNELIEFIFSIPDSYRFKNRLYAEMLLKRFPEFFADIPWQRTGRPIGGPGGRNLGSLIGRAADRIRQEMGLRNSTRDFTDYANWIRSQESVGELQELLARDGAEYARVIEEDFQDKYLAQHLSKRNVNESEKILRAATMEIYFRDLRRRECVAAPESLDGL